MPAEVLFLILHLHQTTTVRKRICQEDSCFLSCIYIKPQPVASSLESITRCFLSCIYIKPQPIFVLLVHLYCCFLSCIYIKPQLDCNSAVIIFSCFLSCIYIKPQHERNEREKRNVVSYLASTSNHNLAEISFSVFKVVSYLASTSNHNLS